jgi:hypothetical protein
MDIARIQIITSRYINSYFLPVCHTDWSLEANARTTGRPVLHGCLNKPTELTHEKNKLKMKISTGCSYWSTVEEKEYMNWDRFHKKR